MKYFTPKLLERLASADDAVADAAEEEWERAIVRSRRRWHKVQSAFPEAVQHFEKQHVCLHDARVVSMARRDDTFVAILHREPPGQEIVLLIFTLDEDPVIEPDVVPGHGDGHTINWLYEEWDLYRRARCWFEALLSNGWSLRLRFRDFRFLILPQILPAANGKAAEPAASVTHQRRTRRTQLVSP
jgi:hypothetical protein